MVKRRTGAPSRQGTRGTTRLRLVGSGECDPGSQSPGATPDGAPADACAPADAYDASDADLAELIELSGSDLNELNVDRLNLTDLQADTAVEGLVALMLAAMSRCRRPLDAELAVCEGLAPVDQAAPDEATPEQRREARRSLTTQVMARTALAADPDALALLRVCAVLGEPAVRALARSTADALAAAGVPERPWARLVGRPRALRAWRYGDLFGSQESVCVMFGYNAREHVVSVLIDHRRGGGVKDVWLSDGRAARSLRTTMAEAMSGEPACFIEDVELTRAAVLLRGALDEPPCPEQPDQVEDVAAYLPLLRARTALLPGSAPE